jgi:glyoxylase-like metal-dependent hydrolase (beta-lactamase superfamily II)
MGVGNPLYDQPYAADPVSGAASNPIRVGGRTLYAVSDGFLVMRPAMVGTPAHPTAAHDALTAEYGAARLPLGCFFLPGDLNVLVDTGLGPVDFDGNGRMVGGKLLHALAGIGVAPEDIDVVALSHLHGDHSGNLGRLADGHPTFPNADVVVGRGDWQYFILENRSAVPLAAHTVSALHHLEQSGRLRLVDGDIDIAPGVRRLGAPGHTPGHAVYEISDGGDRLLLFGDAMYCPLQLRNLDWSVPFDIDPALARAMRDRFTSELRRDGGRALACHFPELQPVDVAAFVAGVGATSEPAVLDAGAVSPQR